MTETLPKIFILNSENNQFSSLYRNGNGTLLSVSSGKKNGPIKGGHFWSVPFLKDLLCGSGSEVQRFQVFEVLFNNSKIVEYTEFLYQSGILSCKKNTTSEVFYNSEGYVIDQSRYISENTPAKDFFNEVSIFPSCYFISVDNYKSGKKILHHVISDPLEYQKMVLSQEVDLNLQKTVKPEVPQTLPVSEKVQAPQTPPGLTKVETKPEKKILVKDVSKISFYDKFSSNEKPVEKISSTEKSTGPTQEQIEWAIRIKEKANNPRKMYSLEENVAYYTKKLEETVDAVAPASSKYTMAQQREFWQNFIDNAKTQEKSKYSPSERKAFYDKKLIKANQILKEHANLHKTGPSYLDVLESVPKRSIQEIYGDEE